MDSDDRRNYPFLTKLVAPPVIVQPSVRERWIDKLTIVGAYTTLSPLLLFPIHACQKVRRACLIHALVLTNSDEAWKSKTKAFVFRNKALCSN